MIYARKVQTTDSRFGGRAIEVSTTRDTNRIPVPDTVVLCDCCNKNVYPEAGYLIYLDKRELDKDQPYDFYCGDCKGKYFPKAKEVK